MCKLHVNNKTVLNVIKVDQNKNSLLGRLDILKTKILPKVIMLID